jgi:hypothetical protein
MSMNVDRLELVLHELTTDRESRKSFGADPARHLGARGLSEFEGAAICSGDVRTLFQAGVSPLLIMGFWVDTLRRPLDAYVRALNEGRSSTGVS